MNNNINHKTCKKCLLCISICPAKIIEEKADNTVDFIQKKIHTCLKCGQCMAICETQSILIDGCSYENIFNLNENVVDYEKFFDFLSHRRSVRNFKNKNIEKEKIEKIIETLSLTPFGAKKQSVELTIINNRDIIEKALPIISDFYNKMEKWLHNPFMKFMIKKNAGIEKYHTINEHLLPRIKLGHYDIKKSGDNITRNAPALILFHGNKLAEEHTNDAYILLIYSMLAANSIGLGSTIIGLVPPAINKTNELKQLFEIPVENEVVASLILGYPKYSFKKGIKRPKTKVHWIE